MPRPDKPSRLVQGLIGGIDTDTRHREYRAAETTAEAVGPLCLVTFYLQGTLRPCHTPPSPPDGYSTVRVMHLYSSPGQIKDLAGERVTFINFRV